MIANSKGDHLARAAAERNPPWYFSGHCGPRAV